MRHMLVSHLQTAVKAIEGCNTALGGIEGVPLHVQLPQLLSSLACGAGQCNANSLGKRQW